MDSGTKIKRSENIVARDLTPGEGGVLLHLESAEYFSVNQLGMFIWDALESERTIAELVDEVRAAVESPPPTLDDDVLAFLTASRERGIVIVE